MKKVLRFFGLTIIVGLLISGSLLGIARLVFYYAYGPISDPLSRSITTSFASQFQAQKITEVVFRKGFRFSSTTVRASGKAMYVETGSCNDNFRVDTLAASRSKPPVLKVRSTVNQKTESYQNTLTCIQNVVDQALKEEASKASTVEANESTWTAAAAGTAATP